MNRKIAIAPLMLAFIMLLAHLTVPHHHHHGTIICLLNYSNEIVAESHCLDTHHIDADNSEANNHEGSDSHKSGNGDNEENCFIDDLYMLSDSKHSVDIVPVDLNNICFSFLHLSVSNPFHLNLLAELPFREKPFLISYKSSLNSDATGLRGPPVC